VGVLDRVGVGVHGVDGRLEQVGASLAEAQRGAHQCAALVDHRWVPSATVLIAQQDE